MLVALRPLTPFFLILFSLCFIEVGLITDYADARSRSGGRSFSRSTTPKKVTSPTTSQTTQPGLGRGLAGGLIGGALGGLLLGSMFGMGGSGMGILPILILAGVGFFLYRRMSSRSMATPGNYNQSSGGGGAFSGQTFDSEDEQAPSQDPVADGLAMIRRNDAGFDDQYFLEVASDVFFKIQAGWMRRDLSSYGHLLGSRLAEEYDKHFQEMKGNGQINKLESISIRQVKIVAAGSENREDFVTVLFTANLLDYTVDDKNGELVEGSMTEPVKFAEEWTWARATGTEAWRLEGINIVEG